MVKFIDIDPNDVPNHREGRRGRVSYPILKSFLETNKYIVQLDRTGMQQSFQALYSSLSAYIRNHDLPIKLMSRQNQIILMRLDIDADGNFIEDWREQRAANATTEGHKATEAHFEPKPLDDIEVEKRFQEEVNKVTK